MSRDFFFFFFFLNRFHPIKVCKVTKTHGFTELATETLPKAASKKKEE